MIIIKRNQLESMRLVLGLSIPRAQLNFIVKRYIYFVYFCAFGAYFVLLGLVFFFFNLV